MRTLIIEDNTELANLLAARIGELTQQDILAVIHEVRVRANRNK